MSKLIYTEQGIQLARVQSASEFKISNSKLSSPQPKQIRNQNISQQCSQYRNNVIKNAYTASHRALTPNTDKKLKRIPTAMTSSTQNSQNNIAKHHKQSLRLITGEWLQWKNLPLSPTILDKFSKLLKPTNIQELKEMREEKKKQIYQKSLIKIHQQEQILQDKILKNQDEQNINYFKDKDNFWVQFMEQKKKIDKQSNILKQEETRMRNRLSEYSKLKYERSWIKNNVFNQYKRNNKSQNDIQSNYYF